MKSPRLSAESFPIHASLIPALRGKWIMSPIAFGTTGAIDRNRLCNILAMNRRRHMRWLNAASRLSGFCQQNMSILQQDKLIMSYFR